MKIIYSDIIPLKGYQAMMLFGIIFARKSARPLDPETINHEAIHHAPARKDCKLYLWYYIRYAYWWIRRGYRNSPFEREAYANEKDLSYLDNRPKGAWKKYQ